MVNFMFNDEGEDLSYFGRAARDDFSMTAVARPLDFLLAQHPEPSKINVRGAAYEAFHPRRTSRPNTLQRAWMTP